MTLNVLDGQQKRCRRCHEVKPLTEFSPLKHGRFGVATQCKTCLAERQRTYRAEHPQITFQNNHISKVKRREMRLQVITLLGDHCVYCGCSEYEALEIHYTNTDGAREGA